MKKKYRILYLEIAKTDLAQIFDYILKDNPKSALKILEKFDQTISKLAEFPELGRQPKHAKVKALGYRVLIIQNYFVFYIIKEESIEIHRILHGTRDYKNLI